MKKISVFSIVGFVLSIVSITFCNYAFYTVFLVTIPALVFCIIGIKDRRYKRVLAVIGLVICVVSLQLGILAPKFISYVNRAKAEVALQEETK